MNHLEVNIYQHIEFMESNNISKFIIPVIFIFLSCHCVGKTDSEGVFATMINNYPIESAYSLFQDSIWGEEKNNWRMLPVDFNENYPNYAKSREANIWIIPVYKYNGNIVEDSIVSIREFKQDTLNFAAWVNYDDFFAGTVRFSCCWNEEDIWIGSSYTITLDNYHIDWFYLQNLYKKYKTTFFIEKNTSTYCYIKGGDLHVYRASSKKEYVKKIVNAPTAASL